MTDTIDFKRGDDGIAILTLDVPGRSMNVLTPQLMQDLESAIERVAGDDAVRGAVITSGKSAFMAGADLKDLVNAYDSGRSPEEMLGFSAGLSRTLRRLETCGKPFVAAINGTALGGGLELCLACHHRVAADEPKARLGQPEVMVGLLPGAGATQRLPRMIGIEKALRLMVEGTHLSPQKALETGVVDAVVPAGELIDAARRWITDGGAAEQPWDRKGFKVPGGAGAMDPRSVQTFMAGSALLAQRTQHCYPAPIAIMSCVYEGTIVPFDTGLAIESRYFTQLLCDPVARNMIRTLFINKGAADKLVRRPAGVARSRVEKLGILGAGMMGAGIAYVSARAGMEVVLLDASLETAEKGKEYSRGLLDKRVAKGRQSGGDAEAMLARIHPTTDYAQLDNCDLVIEAVFENREIKADVTAKTEAVIPPGSVFASNTSTLPITGLAEASQRPHNFIGLHFFSPVDKMPLVEVILGEQTSDECLARALDYVRQIRKTPIVVRDSRGFYTSRVFGTYGNEGLAMVSEGINPALIENAAKMAGMAVGPLAVMDEVTLELGYKIHMQTASDLGDAYEPPAGTDVLVKFCTELDRRGKRFGKGLYEYPEGGRKHLWPGIAEVYPRAAQQPDVEEVKKRLLYRQAIETVRCLDEGVVQAPADADVGAILGWGFGAWTGGPLSLIDTVGVAEFVAECDRLAEQYGKRFAVPDSLRAKAQAGERYYAKVTEVA